MLYKLSLKNIKKSLKDYAIYFFTLILGVAIFYVFNAIDSQTVMLNVTSSTYEIIDLMVNILSGVSIFVSFILGFLIIYASRFLIKRRNKEFGIYLTLGMSKRKISFILFLETLFIGILSLIIGLIIGVLASQFMSILVANMFEADLTQFTFVFSLKACLKTMIYFSIMYLIVMIFNTLNISKCKLIDLLQASKKTETIKLKNPIICIIIFILSAIVLGHAYWMVTAGFKTLTTVDKIMKPIFLGAVSTFFIIWSLSGLILKIVMSIKRLYYKRLNSFTLRQISSKINTTVFSMTIICLMLFITICVLSASLTIKNSLQANANKLSPADIQLTKVMNLKDTDLEQGYNENQIKNSNLDIKSVFETNNLGITENLQDITEINIYHLDNLTLRTTLGNSLDNIISNYPFLRYDAYEDIVKLSDYNKIANLYGNQEYTLNDNQYLIIADFKSMTEVRNIALNQQEKINIFKTTLEPKCQDGFIELSAQHINSGIIVVPDSVVEDTAIAYNVITANYQTTNPEKRQKVENQIEQAITSIDQNSYNLISINTKLDIINASVGLGALITFIGLYLGIIFLISAAAILALKELSESSDNIERFQILRKIGTDEKLLNKALFHQIAIFFLLPLILAIIHSVFGIMFSIKVLETFGNDQLLPSIIMTAIFIIMIYGGYFLITYLCSKNIIKERN